METNRKLYLFAGNFHRIEAAKELKEKNIITGITLIYLAHQFYRSCEYINGINKCISALQKLGVPVKKIEERVDKEGVVEAFSYVEDFLDDLCKYFPPKEGKEEKAISLCYRMRTIKEKYPFPK